MNRFLSYATPLVLIATTVLHAWLYPRVSEKAFTAGYWHGRGMTACEIAERTGVTADDREVMRICLKVREAYARSDLKAEPAQP